MFPKLFIQHYIDWDIILGNLKNLSTYFKSLALPKKAFKITQIKITTKTIELVALNFPAMVISRMLPGNFPGNMPNIFIALNED